MPSVEEIAASLAVPQECRAAGCAVEIVANTEQGGINVQHNQVSISFDSASLIEVTGPATVEAWLAGEHAREVPRAGRPAAGRDRGSAGVSWTKVATLPVRVLACVCCEKPGGTLERLGGRGTPLIHKKCRLAYMHRKVREAEKARAAG